MKKIREMIKEMEFEYEKLELSEIEEVKKSIVRKYKNKSSLEIARDNYSEYSAFILRGRALPSILDGMKNVERRLVWVMLNYSEEKIEKSSAIEGDTLKLHPHGSCILGDTKFYTLSNEYKTIESLYNSKERNVEVLTYNEISGKIEPGIIEDIWITKYVNELYQLKLSNEYNFYLTGEHRILSADRGFIRVDELLEGEELVSTSIYNLYNRPIVKTQNYKNCYRELIQRLVLFDKIEYKRGYDIHHKNKDKNDNRSENLLYLSKSEHSKSHKNEGLVGLKRNYATKYQRVILSVKSINLIKLEKEVPVYDFSEPRNHNALFYSGTTNSEKGEQDELVCLHNCYGSLVKLAQLGDNFLIEAHGNFGSRDLKPSAHRYTSARLTKISRMIWKYYKYSDMIDGELDGYKEPEAIPSLLPLSLIAGTEGMGSGLATVYPEFNPISLVDSMLEILREGEMINYPKLDYSEHLKTLVDKGLLEKGKGRITFQSKIYGDKELVIKARPPRLTWENLESIAEKLKLSINNLGDEIVFSSKTSLSANKLEALKVKLEESLKKKIAYDMLAYKDNQALLVSVKDILTQSLELLVAAVEKYKEAEIRKLEKELRVLKAQEFLSQRLDKVVSMNIDKLIDSEKADLESLNIDTADIKLASSRSLSSFTKIREKISAKESELSEAQKWIVRDILISDYEELREELVKYDKNAKREPS